MNQKRKKAIRKMSGQMVRVLRMKNNLTQEALAKILKMSRPSIVNIEGHFES